MNPLRIDFIQWSNTTTIRQQWQTSRLGDFERVNLQTSFMQGQLPSAAIKRHH